MRGRPRARFWIELGAAGAAFGLLVLTAVERDWIEAVFGAGPDRGDGSAEWTLVRGLVAALVLAAALARREWTRPAR